jgi:HEPN domain-containing protein
MAEDVEYWLELARLDLDSARKSLQGTSYLVRLAALAGLSLESRHRLLLTKLSLEYIELRYPEELDTIDELNSRGTAEQHLQQTEELFQWLEAQRK